MRFCFWSFIASLAGLLSPAFCASFQGLGFLPGETYSAAKGISDNGQYIIGLTHPLTGSVFYGFIWSQSTGMVSMGNWPNGDTKGMVNDVSDEGTAIGSYAPTASGPSTIFRWTVADGFQSIGSPDWTTLPPSAISPDGLTIYGNGVFGGTEQGFRWTQATGMVSIGNPAGYTDSSVHAASSDGSIVVGDLNSEEYAYRWTASGGYQVLSGGSSALAVSADGSTVAGFQFLPGFDFEAFRWTAGTGTTYLGTVPGGSQFIAHSVSGDGSVITGDYSGGAFIWDAVNGIRDFKSVMLSFGLDVSSWSFSDAWVAADGVTFGGSGIDPSGHQEAWIAVLPEPSVGTLLISGGILLVRRKRAESQAC